MTQKARLVKRAEVVEREANARATERDENQTTIRGRVGGLVQWVKQSQRSAESKGASSARERFDALFARS